MADLARRTQSRPIGRLIASAAAVAVLREARSGPDRQRRDFLGAREPMQPNSSES